MTDKTPPMKFRLIKSADEKTSTIISSTLETAETSGREIAKLEYRTEDILLMPAACATVGTVINGQAVLSRRQH